MVFRTLTLCGILADLKQDFRNASFEYSDDRNLLTVTAPDTEMLAIHKKILKNVGIPFEFGPGTLDKCF